MYHHLLVPIDDTDLSVDVVGNAVAFARTLAARITFFHAVPDAAADLLHGDAEVLRADCRRRVRVHLRHGKAGELLAKAEAAARALGVPCGSRQAVSDRPAQAVIDAARSSGCDLIFMASHGHRSKLGMAFSSETLSVLMNAGLPVLVSSTGELPPPARAIGIIRDEHRSLAAVMHAWMQALDRSAPRGHRGRPGADALDRAVPAAVSVARAPSEGRGAAVRAPARAHHHIAMPSSTSSSASTNAMHSCVAALAQQVEALAAGEPATRVAATARCDDEVSRYADFLWDHLGREEGVILPAAQRHLLADDWAGDRRGFRAEPRPDVGRRCRQGVAPAVRAHRPPRDALSGARRGRVAPPAPLPRGGGAMRPLSKISPR